jgi:hypothetical protein
MEARNSLKVIAHQEGPRKREERKKRRFGWSEEQAVNGNYRGKILLE